MRKTMSKYDPDYAESNKQKKHKNPKFRDYYDEDFSDADDIALYSKKKKLDKKPKRQKNPDHDWPKG